jgi:hypothetical protein
MVKRKRAMTKETEISCKNRRKRVVVGSCLEDYMNSNALEKRRSACWRCFQGKKIRHQFSET